jgi:site-specific recombinase XerD
MGLDAVVAGKDTYGLKKSPSRSVQPSPFPKQFLRPAYGVSSEIIDRVLHQIATDGLGGGGLVGDYLRRQLRHNCRPNTLRASGATISLFLAFLKRYDGARLEAISKEHINAFVEHEQDRGMAATTVDARLRGLYAFLNYLVRRDVIGAEVIQRKLRIRVPEALPKAIDPEDVQQLLAAIETTRDRALILTLLRTGMRIGELLNTRVEDLNLTEQRVRIIEAQKNRVGRVVYLSTDAANALATWMQTRRYSSEFLFYGQGAGRLSYEAARMIFTRCIERAGLAHKGYTLHCLRHTYASELLNAGMPLQCLQELLGHHCIEMTRRYARLTDNTRRAAYYKAMSIIEAGEINGHYRLDHQLP